MVELITSSSGFFHQGFRLSVTHQRRRKSDSHGIISPCHHSLTSNVGQFYQQGSIVSPPSLVPSQRRLHLDAITSSRIWLEIDSKSNKLSTSWTPSHTINNNATCFHRLQLHRTSSDPAEQMTNGESNSSSSSGQLSSMPTLLVRDRVQLKFTSLKGSMTGSEMDFNFFDMLLPEQVPVVSETL
jgi:hypothetical protein